MRATELLLGIAAVAVGLLAIDGVGRLLESRPSVTLTPGGLTVRDTTLGWHLGNAGVYEEKASKNGTIIYDAKYTIDKQNQRLTLSSNSGNAVVFIGDSFTFGTGVNDADTMPQAFSDLLSRRLLVLNLGVPAYSPQQFLRAMETGLYDSSIGRNPALFVFLTAPWQIERVTCKASYVTGAPRYVLDTFGVPRYAGSCKSLTDNWVFARSALYKVFIAPLLAAPSSYDKMLYEAEILRAVELARERYHVATIILFLAGSSSDDVILRDLRLSGLTVVDASLVRHASEDATIAIPGDFHPTPLAHRLRAQLLENYLLKHMPGVLKQF